jgi:hypothetical protein
MIDRDALAAVIAAWQLPGKEALLVADREDAKAASLSLDERAYRVCKALYQMREHPAA